MIEQKRRSITMRTVHYCAPLYMQTYGTLDVPPAMLFLIFFYFFKWTTTLSTVVVRQGVKLAILADQFLLLQFSIKIILFLKKIPCMGTWELTWFLDTNYSWEGWPNVLGLGLVNDPTHPVKPNKSISIKKYIESI